MDLSNYTSFINKTFIDLAQFISILIIGLVIGRFLGKLSYKLLHEFEVNRLLGKRLNVVVQIEKVASKFVQYSIYIMSFLYALKTANVSIKFLYYILVLILIILAIYIVLQVKDYIENLIIGIFFINKEFLKTGQKIKIKNMEGTIIKITPTEIKLLTNEKDTLFIPNAVLMKSSLFKKQVKNKISS